MYVIKNNKTDLYIAIDQSSGGYPYDVKLQYAKIFNSIIEAEEYKNICKKDWTIHNLWISSSPISETKN
jgi:hypothetical protein